MSDVSVPQRPPGKDLMEWILENYAASKIQGNHIRNYNGANLAYNHAASTANNLGLSEEQRAKITPFPTPETTNVNIGGGDGDDKKMSGFTKNVIAAAIGASLLGGGIAIHELIDDDRKSPPVAAPADPEGEVGFTVR